jgi:hypothetical protein
MTSEPYAKIIDSKAWEVTPFDRRFTADSGKVIKEKVDLVIHRESPEPVVRLSMMAGKESDRCAVTAPIARSLRN